MTMRTSKRSSDVQLSSSVRSIIQKTEVSFWSVCSTRRNRRKEKTISDELHNIQKSPGLYCLTSSVHFLLSLVYLLSLLMINDQLLFTMIDQSLGKPSFQKSAVFFNIVQKAFDPPLLFEHLSYFAGGVFWTRFWAFDIMYLFHPQISPSMPQKSLFMQISCC